MKDKIKIGSFQGGLKDNDFKANLDKVKSVLENTKDKELDFLCFPETYLSGYSKEAIMESSVSLNSPDIIKFIKYTENFDTVVLLGLSERKNGDIYNSQLVVHKGKILGTAHKTMLTGYDKKYFTTDLHMPVFKAKGVNFGVAICHTTSFVEPALYLRLKGARLLFTPHFNKIRPDAKSKSGKKHTFWNHRTMVLNNQAALATLLKMVVVRSNTVTIEPEGLGSGDSNIWDMNGVLIAKGQPFTECVVTAQFDKKIFNKEHTINRKEIPDELYKMICKAGLEYNAE